MNSIDFKDEAAVKDYIDRLGVEYRFQCFGEGRTDGCHRLGDWLEFSMKDWVKAGRVYKSNCLLHDYGHSCGKFANYAFLGRGTERKVDEAAEFYRKGCYSAEHPYAPACYNYGLMVAKGDLKVAEPVKDSQQAFERGCDLKDAGCCTSAAVSSMQSSVKDFVRAFKFAEKGCEMDQFDSCQILSNLYRNGEGCEKDEQMAEQYKAKGEAIARDMTEERPNVTFGQ